MKERCRSLRSLRSFAAESDSFAHMPGSLIPLLIAAIILVPLGVLLWLGARERKRFLPMRDEVLGKLKLFKTHWETEAPQPIGPQTLPVAGVGKSTGPTRSQRDTLDFVKSNAGELFKLAISAAKKAFADAKRDLQPDDLRISMVFLDKDPDSFDLSVDSESCASVIPDGIDVSFTGKQIDEVEFVH